MHNFSVNINALGLPDGVNEAVEEQISSCNKYPELDYAELKNELVNKYLCKSEDILISNGIDDFLYRIALALAPQNVVIVEPTYEEYSFIFKELGSKIIPYVANIENDFRCEHDLFNILNNDIDLLILCNPNNPTGNLISKDMMNKIIEYCLIHRIYVLFDECFLEFNPNWESLTTKTMVSQYPNLIVVDGFTKTYALAGFRIGFCLCSDSHLLKMIYKKGQLYPVSSLSIVAAIASLRNQEYMERTYMMLENEKS